MRVALLIPSTHFTLTLRPNLILVVLFEISKKNFKNMIAGVSDVFNSIAAQLVSQREELEVQNMKKANVLEIHPDEENYEDTHKRKSSRPCCVWW